MAPRCRGNRGVRLRRAALRSRPHQARRTGKSHPGAGMAVPIAESSHPFPAVGPASALGSSGMAVRERPPQQGGVC